MYDFIVEFREKYFVTKADTLLVHFIRPCNPLNLLISTQCHI